MSGLNTQNGSLEVPKEVTIDTSKLWIAYEKLNAEPKSLIEGFINFCKGIAGKPEIEIKAAIATYRFQPTSGIIRLTAGSLKIFIPTAEGGVYEQNMAVSN